MKNNIGELLANRAYISPDLEGFIGEKRLTFKEMNERVNKFSNYLKDNHMKSGDRLAILAKNNYDYMTTFFASAKLGIISVAINWRLQTREMEHILKDSGATMLVYDDAFSDKIEELKNIVSIDTYVQIGTNGKDISFEETITGRESAEPELGSFNDDPALIMYTSGTTGKPKGAVLTHNNLLAGANGISHTVDWRYRDRFLSVAPLFHIGGFAPIITNVHMGTTSIFMEDFDPFKIWDVIKNEQISIMMSVPAMLTYMIKTVNPEVHDYSSIRNITCGASAVPNNLIHAFKELGLKIQQVYGITEYAGAVSFWNEDMGDEKSHSMGKPVFHGKLKVVDINSGNELPPNEVGEIICFGPQVFKEYWNNPEATNKVFENGWYHSGDLGRFDDEGFIYVIDRLKDMIISGGENIYSAELEAVISNHPEVVEVAVIGIPNEKWGEIPKAFIVKKENSSLTAEMIIAHCKENLASYKCVKEIEFIDALPRNAVGKIQKHMLKK